MYNFSNDTSKILNMNEFYVDTLKKYNKRKKDIDVDTLRENLIVLDKMYGEGKLTPLSNEEYDTLHSIYTDLTGDNIYGDISSESKVEHEYPDLKGTIEKVHYITNKEKEEDDNAIEAHKTLEDWIIKTLGKLTKGKDIIEYDLGFFPKYDGLSVVLSLDSNGYCTRAVTRGDVDEGVGQDKTNVFRGIRFDNNVPVGTGACGLKIEFLMTKEKFKEYNKRCCNNELVDERAGAVSLLNTENFSPVMMKYAYLMPLMYQPKGDLLCSYVCGPYGPKETVEYTEYTKFSDFMDMVKEAIESLTEEIEKLDVKCDGIVVRWIDREAIDILGRNDERSINNFEIAYKFPQKSNYTRLIDIHQDIGTLGNVSYTAEFEPFEHNGRTVRHASLGSVDRMRALKLAKGDMVNVKYDIIPYLTVDAKCKENRSGNPPIEPITECPYCHEPIVEDDDTVPYCGNKNCPSRIMGKIYNYCEKLKMQFIGPALIETLFHAGIVRSIPDLYRLDTEENMYKILSLEGFGKKSYDRLIDSIRKPVVEEYVILGSVGIPTVGIKKAKRISNIYNIRDLLEMSETVATKKLSKIEGIGKKTAKVIHKGVDENRQLLEFLLKQVKIVDRDLASKKPDVVICFTGFRNPKFAAYLENDLNFEVVESVTKKTNLVIAKNVLSNSDKIRKAKELGIKIISYDEAVVEFGYNF